MMSLASTGVRLPFVSRYWFSRIALPLPWRMDTPLLILKPIVLEAGATGQPIVLPDPPETCTAVPLPRFPLGLAAFVPRKFPSTTLAVAPLPRIWTPTVLLNPIVLAAALPAVTPPMVLLGAPLIRTPMWLSRF